MRYCCIIVVGKQGFGTAMLIRAVEPLDDTTKKLLYQCRPGHAGNGLSNGPAKLCKTIGIDTTFNGHDLTKMPLKLQMKKAIPDENTELTIPIGIRQDT